TSYTDSGLSAGTSYSYRITATNAGGNGTVSGTGSTATRTIAPGAPVFTNVGATRMTLNYAPPTGAASYKIWRCTGACSIPSLIYSGTTTIAATDSGLTPATSYSYVVQATNAGGDSAFSATSTQITLPLPGAPGGAPTFTSVTPVS